MADLRERFAALDRVRAPDQWRHIETRRPVDLPFRGRRGRMVGTVVALLVVTAGVALAARAFVTDHGQIPVRAPRTASGEIWFRLDGGDGRSSLFRIRPDGTGEALVWADARGPSAPHERVYPLLVGSGYDWNPAGTELVFSQSGRFSEGPTAPATWELYTATANGSRSARITHDNGLASFPSWSPDGARIAYSSASGKGVIAGCEGSDQCPSDIYVIASDGSGRRRLTDQPTDDSEPDWSPDGTRIVFRSTRDSDRGEIYVMGADGSDVRRLTFDSSLLKHTPVWSPDGSRIAFVGDDQIYVMNADGSGLTRSTDVAGNSFVQDLVWSPDGSKLAFSTDAGGEAPALYVMDADGGPPGRLAVGGVGDIAWRTIMG
jgi:dipeptidyl aminopeptidase/acylaminoacyl peptidase